MTLTDLRGPKPGRKKICLYKSFVCKYIMGSGIEDPAYVIERGGSESTVLMVSGHVNKSTDGW